MGKPWLGNSQQGEKYWYKQKLNNYAFRILRDEKLN